MRAISLLILLLCCAGARASVPTVEIRGVAVNYSPATLVALPGERLQLGTTPGQRVSLEGTGIGAASEAGWVLQAPEQPGHYSLQVSNEGANTMDINLFVTVPATAMEEGWLNGYRMGPPPPARERFPGQYEAPSGFIEVTEDLLDLQLSPHFSLRQFLCKQQSAYPKYLAMDETLLVLLEGLLGAVRERGYAVDTFGVISGYRTPWYNRQIGNVVNSRHVYGDAMDLYVDADGDGLMDDLNRDGKRDRADVELLATIAEEYMASEDAPRLRGGVGRYGKTSRHGGFVHVDTRGYTARWGLRSLP